jgi:hypothetical protein
MSGSFRRRTRGTFEESNTWRSSPLTATLSEAETVSRKIKAEFERS